MIHFHSVQKTVDSHQLFTDLTLFLPKTSYTLLSGEPQSGKTTLLRMIMAYEKPDAGSLQVDDIGLAAIPSERIPHLRRLIGLIATTPILLEDRSVIENIAVPLQLAGFDDDTVQQRLETMLETTGLIDEKQTTVNRLNAVTRHLVSTARAIIHKPAILLADEPFEQLDTDTADLIAALLNEANTQGTTVLLTCDNDEQYIHRVSSECKTLTLHQGAIQQNEKQQLDTRQDNSTTKS